MEFNEEVGKTINHSSLKDVSHFKEREQIEKDFSQFNAKLKTKFKNSFSYFPENFVPKLKPKKSSIIPPSFLLNHETKNEHNNVNIEIISEKEFSSDHHSSSELDSSDSVKYNNDSESSSSDLEGEENKDIESPETKNKENFCEDEEELKFEELQKNSLSFYQNKMKSLNLNYNNQNNKNEKNENNSVKIDSNKTANSSIIHNKTKPLLIKDVLFSVCKK